MAKAGLRKRLSSRLSHSVLRDTYVNVMKSRKHLLVTMLIDALFLASLVVVNKALGIFVPDPGRALMAATTRIGLILALVALCFIFLVLIYSLFKYQVLSRLRLIFEGKKADPALFGRFFRCNLASIGIFVAAFIVFSAVFILSIKVDILATVRDIFYSLFAVIAYLWTNIAHSLFATGTHRSGALIRKTADLIFGNFRKYLGIISFTAIAFAALAAGYLLLDWVIVNLLGSAILVPAVYYTYAAMNTVIIFILVSGLVAFNRAYFYNIVKRQESSH